MTAGPTATPEPARNALGVGVIMDGNGRWAQRRGLPITDGHSAGGKALRRTVEAALDLGVQQLTVYAFSTENWQREPDEVAGIMALFDELLRREAPDLNEQQVRIRFLGRHDEMASHLIDRMRWARQLTERNQRMDLIIAFNYGGRTEIADAANRIVRRHGPEVKITPELISANMYDEELRDPDVIIRTAGEKRLSNFLLWQSAYSELIFTETLWPDFGREELTAALDEYHHRERRFGGRDPEHTASPTPAGMA